MINSLAVMEGLTILARWLEDNINCESDICFDDPETGTDSEKILPCVEAALILMSATLPNDGQELGAAMLLGIDVQQLGFFIAIGQGWNNRWRKTRHDAR